MPTSFVVSTDQRIAPPPKFSGIPGVFATVHSWVYVIFGSPNIPGVIRGIQGVVDPAADGSFSIAPGAIENNIAGSNDQYIETAFSVIFSASNGNSTYGASNTVQPNSLRALVLVRAY